MMSYTWAMSMFGVQQAINLITPAQGGDQTAKCGQSFDKVTDATAKTFDNATAQAFKAGDSMQRAMVDLMFGGFLAGGLDPNRWMRMGSDAMRQATDAAGRTAQAATDAASQATAPTSDGSGWGSMPR